MEIEVIKKVREGAIDIKPENTAIITRSPNKHSTVNVKSQSRSR